MLLTNHVWETFTMLIFRKYVNNKPVCIQPINFWEHMELFQLDF